MENENKINKTSRASQTRAKEARKQVWTPPSSLDAPPAPTGYGHRWIRGVWVSMILKISWVK